MYKAGQRTKGKRAICTAMIAAMLLVAAAPAAAPAAAQAADRSYNFVVRQVFSATSDSAYDDDGDTFMYRLTPLAAGTPMPRESTADGYDFTIAGTGSVEVRVGYMLEPGVYRYRLSQVVEAEKPGYIYDRRVYTIELYVGASESYRVVVINEDFTKASAIEFENSYETEDEPGDGGGGDQGGGGDNNQGGGDNNQGGGGNNQGGGDNNNQGGNNNNQGGGGQGGGGGGGNNNQGAGAIEPNKEKEPDERAPENDGGRVSIAIADDDGIELLSAREDDPNPDAGPGDANDAGNVARRFLGFGPKTGDDANAALYITLLAIGGALAVGAVIFLIVGKKRKKRKGDHA